MRQSFVGRFRLRACLLAAALFVGIGSASSQGVPDLARAEALIRQGAANAAWNLLAPHELALAGREDFDYLLGIAALESGRADRATLIFERVLAVNPGHMAARLDMGRAYFALGDLERARTELESVLRFDPPPAARAAAERTLAAIAVQSGARGTKLTGWLEGTLGHDNNVNAGPSGSSLFVPLFGTTFTLASTSTRQIDTFAAMAGGVELSYALDERFSLVAGADFRQRGNFSAAAFDSLSGGARFGAQYAMANDQVRATLGPGYFELNGAYYRRAQIASFDWRHQWDARTLFSVFGQDIRQRYVQAASRAQGANLFILGGGVSRTLDEGLRLLASASLFRGEEVATDGRADGDRRLWGLRAGLQGALRGDADWTVSAAVQSSAYARRNVTFAALRRDLQFDLNLGVNWRVAKDWTLRPQFSYTRNDSNLALNDFDRYELSIALRR